jgi:hypothetical protein
MKAVSSKSYGKHQLTALARCYDSIFFNNGFSKLALLAVGSVIEVVIYPCVFFICWALLFTFIKAFCCYTVLEFGDIALKITLFMCKQVPTAL